MNSIAIGIKGLHPLLLLMTWEGERMDDEQTALDFEYCLRLTTYYPAKLKIYIDHHSQQKGWY
jgi:hypothetical protein